MDNQNNVNLQKPDQAWTDPVSGEVYPGGAPTAMQPAPMDQAAQVPQQTMQSMQPMQQSMSQPMQQPMSMQQPMPQQIVQQPTYSAPMQQQSYGVPMPQQIPNQGVGYQAPAVDNMKFCKFCGGRIPMDAVLCTSCGRQVEQLQGANAGAPTQIIVNNANNNANANSNANMGGMMYIGTPKNKWVAFFLCLFIGYLGGHRFYEGKIGSAILYLFTMGLFGVGVLIDLIIILTKPNPYYV